MALYAIDDDDLIHASDAEPNKIYWCSDCFGPVKKRKGKWQFAHFYHLKTSPSCRLYSKSEDHLIAQMELQRLFPKGMVQLEKPFLKINRVADVCWEKENIIFEIQCSNISEKEVEMRNRDYESLGFDVIWLLDDRRFNKKICKPAEWYLRKLSAYFLCIQKWQVYDQFEVFKANKRVHKSKPLPIDLRRVFLNVQREFDPEIYPEQILQLNVRRHFYGDRLSRALYFPLAMQYERSLEKKWAIKKPNAIKVFFKKYLIQPYLRWLRKKLKQNGYRSWDV